jgi:hypothetical protein
MLLNSSAESYLLLDLSASRTRQLQLSDIRLHSNHLGTRSRRTNIHHEHLVLRQLGDLSLLAVGRLDTEQTTQQKVVHLELCIDLWELAFEAQHETDQTIGTAEGWVDASTDANQATWYGKFERVVLGEEGDDAAVDWTALDGTLIVARDDACKTLKSALSRK